MKASASLSSFAVGAEKEKRPEKVMVDKSVLQCQVQLLPQITDSAYGDSYFKELVDENPGHLPLLVAQIKRLSTPSGRQSVGGSRRKEVESLCGKILAGARPNEVLQHLGSRIDKSEKDQMLNE
jgi:hypothetical protein